MIKPYHSSGKMPWNPFLDDLMYYLTNMYRRDINSDTKMRLLENIKVDMGKFSFLKAPKDIWYNILSDIRDEKKVQLLEEIIKDSGEPKDEYLLAAIDSIKAQKFQRSLTLDPGEWKGASQVVLNKEKIIGKKSTLLPIGFLESGTAAARAVVRIELEDSTGTGFLIDGGWLLTNNHVIGTREGTIGAFIQLNYQFPKGMKSRELKLSTSVKAELELPLDLPAQDSGDFYTDKAEDWTLIRINSSFAKKLQSYGTLALAEKSAVVSDFVNIIQHPGGGPKQLGIYSNTVMYADEQIVQYLTDTNDGASGSPVLNSDWEVVAIHHSGGWMKDPLEEGFVKRNQGTNIHRIKAFLDNLKQPES